MYAVFVLLLKKRRCVVFWKIRREVKFLELVQKVSELKVFKDVSAIPIPQNDSLAFSNKSEFCTSVN